MKNPTDTPRTDACPHCGAEELEGGIMKCHSYAKNHTNAGFRSMLCREREKSQKLEAEVERLGRLLFETRSLLTEFFDCVDIGGLHDGDCNISTEDPEKWELGCNCTTAELRRKYIELYSK